jgi:hypothetical protein
MASFPALMTCCCALLLPGNATAQEPAKGWQFDVGVYGFAAGMSGDVVVRGIPADVDVGFDKIWDNLQLAGMGRVRVAYDRFAVSTDVVYMGLGASKGGVSADFDQWMVQPQLEYRLLPWLDITGGARYNNLNGEIRGPGVLPIPRIPSGTQQWWDPVLGTVIRVPLFSSFSLHVKGDIGGFGVTSDLTWQAEPTLHWRFAKWGSAQAGYRWYYDDYQTGAGRDAFGYDMMIQGPQFGVTFHF